jgi:hypothetical protein
VEYNEDEEEEAGFCPGLAARRHGIRHLVGRGVLGVAATHSGIQSLAVTAASSDHPTLFLTGQDRMFHPHVLVPPVKYDIGKVLDLWNGYDSDTQMNSDLSSS